jgi:hypothetical protein
MLGPCFIQDVVRNSLRLLDARENSAAAEIVFGAA